MPRYPAREGIIDIQFPSFWKRLICLVTSHMWQGGSCKRCGYPMPSEGE